jgi:hypothetical protein
MLAVEVPVSQFLIEHALGVIGSKGASLRDLESTVTYLAYGYDGSRIEPVIYFLYRLLRLSVNSFLLQAASALISGIHARATYPRFFAKAVQHVVAHAWNRKPRLRTRLLYRATILEIAAAVGDTPSWDGWEKFDRAVLRPYAQRTEFPRDFLIPEDNWDHALLQRIKKQPEKLERSLIDRKPSSGDLLEFLVIEGLTIDDPREALPGEPAVENYEDWDVLVVQRDRRKSRRKRKAEVEDCVVA